MTLPSWTREPLVHFLVFGAILYAVLSAAGDPVDPASRSIKVDETTQAQLALGFERVMGRAPTDAELDERIERYVREEVLYREALRLGLDQGDAVVRQRMVAKMDMSAGAAAEAAEPDEALLRSYFEENQDRYGADLALTFRQIYFADEEDARTAAQQASADMRGETISLPGEMEAALIGDVQARFGVAFGQAVAALDPSEDWQGPVQSGFGWHLVWLQAKVERPPSFELVRDRVENDWRNDEIEARKARAFEILRSAYQIEIDR